MQNTFQIRPTPHSLPKAYIPKSGEGLRGGTLYVFDELPSTNRWALENADRLSHGDVIWARNQTTGRGRLNRQWTTPGGRGLTFSIVLDTAQLPFDFTILGQVSALAIACSLDRYGVKAKVKWPNDILCLNEKVAGLLLESAQNQYRIILGIGVNANLTKADFSKMELLRPATSIALIRGKPVRIPILLRHLLTGLDNFLKNIKSQQDFVARWAESDAFNQGECLRIDTLERSFMGTYAGIDTTGRLLLNGEDGLLHCFWTGDVERVSRH